MKLTFLKLGGSLITDKSKPFTANINAIKSAAKQIAKALKANPNLRLVIGNGAGSFAHQSASKYKTVEGFTDDFGKLGACQVHTDALKLHNIVLQELILAGIPAFSLSPSSFMFSQNKKLSGSYFEVFNQVINKNMVPFVFGDVIIDRQIGATIYSTDRIFAEIISVLSREKNFKIEKIIHAGNYDGVRDSNGKIITSITPKNYKLHQKQIGASGSTDVTGGMQDKVQQSLKLAKKNITSIIINGKTRNLVYRALIGPFHQGTTISFS